MNCIIKSMLFPYVLLIFYMFLVNYDADAFMASNIIHKCYQSSIVLQRHTLNYKRSNLLKMSTKHSFNPFTSRNRNTNVKWFESDLDSFYTFVEEQPRLNGDQEKQFGKAMQMWSKVETIRDKIQSEKGVTHTVTDDELAEAIDCSIETLQKMANYAELAKTKLVNSNLKLVLAVVSRYRTSGIPNSELIAEGTRGLARASLRFDHSKGFRFATYATWYVHQAVSEYVRWRRHPAKMPSRYLLLLRKVKQFTTDYLEATGKVPTVQQIASGLQQSHFDVIKVLSMQTYPALLCSPVKYNDSWKSQDGKERTLEDVLPSLYKAPLAQSDGKDLRRDMERMMQANLNDVERDILRLRLGLDDGRVKPIKEVGRKFKISWKQVKSVEKKALNKLLESEEISGFVDSYHSV